MVTDNLDGRLVGTDCTITTEAPELAGRRAFWRRINILRNRQGRMRYVVDDSYREMILRLLLLQVFKDAENMGRCRILTA